MKRARVWSIFLIVLGITLCVVQLAFTVKIMPFGPFDLGLPQGTSETFSFTVENDEAEDITVKVSLADWYRDIDGVTQFIEPQTLSRSCAGWININPTQFTLPPGEVQEVRFTIEIPEGVEGTYWSAIMVRTEAPEEVRPGTTIIVVRQWGIKILETPPGTAKKDGQITDMELLSSSPLTIMVEFENTGNANLNVEGEVEIVDQMGTTVETMVIESFPILPGGKRRLEVVGQAEQLPPGQYRAIAKLDFGGEFLIAKVLDFEIEG